MNTKMALPSAPSGSVRQAGGINLEMLFAGAAVIVGGFLVYLFFRRTGRRLDDAYREGVLEDAAEWLSGQCGIPRADIQQALRELVEGGGASPLLEFLVRIDCELVKEGPDRISRTVVVAVRRGGKLVVGRIKRELAWDELPGEVREAFMREKDKVQTRVVVEKASATE